MTERNAVQAIRQRIIATSDFCGNLAYDVAKSGIEVGLEDVIHSLSISSSVTRRARRVPPFDRGEFGRVSFEPQLLVAGIAPSIALQTCMDADPASGPLNILLYGPPAAGKLTVARALAARYGLKVLDNHASTDPALRLFGFDQLEQFHALVERLRVELLRTAAHAGLSVVSTLVFADPDDRAHVAKLVEAFESGGGRTGFVHLLPRREILEQRVTDQARTRSEKISEVAELRRLMSRWEVTHKINAEDLAIDNSDISATEVAETIAQHFWLSDPH